MPRMKAIAKRNPDGRRHEVVIREAGHLRDIAHRGLADIVLPVGIGGERCGRVERQRRDRRRQTLRIARQACAAGARSRTSSSIDTPLNSSMVDGVFRPAHLVAFVDTGQPVEQPLERPSTGSRKVRSRLKTRAMNTPSGLVTAKISRQKQAGSETTHSLSFQNFSGLSSA